MTSDKRTFDSPFPQLNPNPVIEVDASGKVTFFNSDTRRILESLGMDKGNVAVFLPSDLDAILKDLKNKEEATFYREIPISDNIFAATVHLVPQFGVVRIYAHDVTERKRAEKVMQARLRMATAAYTDEISVDSLLRLTLDELEALTGSQIGFYHYLEEDQETLSLQSWSTNTVKTMCTAEGSGSHYNISQAGVWVDCVRERRPVIHNDYASLPHRKGMPAGHAPVIREMVVPIMRGDRIMAIIGIGNKKTDYNTTDIEIAQLLGDFSWEIVERKRAEEALREGEERYRSLFENMLHGVAQCKMLYDEVGRPSDFIYLDVNSAFGKLTGLENVVGKRVTEVIPGIREAHPELFEIYGRVALIGRPERFEIEFKPLGLWIAISVYSTEKGYFVAVFDDITERKRAEAELQRLNKALKALSDSSQAVIRAKDEPQYLNDVCRIIIEDCGYSMVWVGFAENDEAKSVRPAAHAGFEDGYLETLQITWADTERGRGPTGTAIRTGKVAMCRNMLIDPVFAPWREQAARRGYASSIVFPLSADDRVFGAITIYSKEADPFSEGEVKLLTELADNLAYGIEVLRIRTAQKQAEEDVLKLSEDMAARNVELEMVNKELESFIYSISHDLRAPIRAMSGFARIMVEEYTDRIDDQGKEYLARILRGSEKMTKLIDDLLHLSKISRQAMERTEVDMSKIASSVVAELRESDPGRSVEVNIAEGLTASADPRLIEIVLSNILGNAWKFTSKTENARIEFGAVKKGEGPTTSPLSRWDWKGTVYYVWDNGAGFNPEYVEKVFLPFHRLHSDDEFEGTGIGLTIVERIIQRHGGRIWAEGEPEKGATIYFTLG